MNEEKQEKGRLESATRPTGTYMLIVLRLHIDGSSTGAIREKVK